MFTGIVEELGTVTAREDRAGAATRLVVHGPRVVGDARPGDSIAVNGCCLTVTDLDGETFAVDVVHESLARTSIGGLRTGGRVNLERALPADGRFGGHVVQGHVDGTGTVVDRTDGDDGTRVVVRLPAALARYVVAKGSIAVDGTSLTVVDVADDATDGTATFSVALIPTTLAATTLGALRPGDVVNLEVDLLAKYVERLVR